MQHNILDCKNSKSDPAIWFSVRWKSDNIKNSKSDPTIWFSEQLLEKLVTGQTLSQPSRLLNQLILVSTTDGCIAWFFKEANIGKYYGFIIRCPRTCWFSQLEMEQLHFCCFPVFASQLPPTPSLFFLQFKDVNVCVIVCGQRIIV